MRNTEPEKQRGKESASDTGAEATLPACEWLHKIHLPPYLALLPLSPPAEQWMGLRSSLCWGELERELGGTAVVGLYRKDGVVSVALYVSLGPLWTGLESLAARSQPCVKRHTKFWKHRPLHGNKKQAL